MGSRSIGSTVVSFGLVTIPVKMYSAASSQSVGFHLMHNKCGHRISQQRFCGACNQVVEWDDLDRGFEVEKDTYVKFTKDELKALEAEKSGIEIVKFVPLSSVDPVFYDKTYYLGPDKGGDKAYTLLSESMAKSGKVAIAQFVMRGKDTLVLIRPAMDGLILQTMYFGAEVHDFNEVPRKVTKASDNELKLAAQLIESLSEKKFDPEEFEDQYSKRIIEVAESKQGKVEGKKIAAVGGKTTGKVVDLAAALKASITKKAEKAEKAEKKSAKK